MGHTHFMKYPSALFAALAAFIVLLSCRADAQEAPPQITVTTSDSAATLSAVTDGVAAGSPLPLLLTLKPQPGWHTYWQNPGDAGAPLDLTWHLPDGWQAAPIRWPLPERIETPPLVSFGYSGPVTFPLTITPPATLAGSETTLAVDARYLVCADTCIPQRVTLHLKLPVVATPHMLATNAWDTAQASLPQDTAPLTPGISRNGTTVQLTFPSASLPAGDWREAAFFPLPTGALVHSAAQQPQFTPEGLTLTLTPQDGFQGDMPGVLRLTSAEGATLGIPIHTTLPESAAASTSEKPLLVAPHPATLGPLTAVLLAFLGGLILNIMPCVFPVLSLKVLALSRHSGREHRETLRESLAYAFGVIGSFVALAGILLLLRSAVGELGWGFQLQEPWFVGALALLLFAVGLNLSGVYEIPQLWQGSQPHRQGLLQSALTGVLAVLLATPCTAPFMAPAIGFGLTQPPLVTLAIFAALGFGFALPFIIAGLYPRLLGFLPRPGGWMLTFRRVLAFPMYASAIWLVWVVAQQSTPNGVGLVLVGGLILAGALLLGRHLGRSGGFVLALLTGLSLLSLLQAVPSAPTQQITATAETFSEERLASLRAAGQPVFVNVTAAWCITCKLNERLVLKRPEVQSLFQERGVTMLIADWTRGDPAITAYLRSFDREGVPLYVYYAPSKQPSVLKQILNVIHVTEIINEG